MSALRLLAITLLAVSPLVAHPAAAADIMIAGTFDGSLGSQSFAAQAMSFHGSTVADDPDEVFDELQYALSSLTVTLQGTNYIVTEPTMFFFAPSSSLAGIVDLDASKGLIRFDYGRNNAVLVDALTQSFATDHGTLSIGVGTGVRFSGVNLPGGAGAVPEPATWAMMLIGFAAAGTVLGRRTRATKASSVQPNASSAAAI